VMVLAFLVLACGDATTEPPRSDAPPKNSLAATATQTCLIELGGGIVCWGWVGSTSGSGLEETPPRRLIFPDANLRFSDISAGASSMCAIAGSQKLYCWGSNIYGELGDGTRTPRSTPVAVASEARFTEVGVGVYSVCGRTVANELHCWGRNDHGHIASGSAREGEVQLLPARVNTSLQFSELSPGWMFCGLVNNGAVYCWGAISGSFDPLAHVEPGSCADYYVMRFVDAPCSTPTRVRTNMTFASLGRTVGPTKCALDREGAAYCWGEGRLGTLGNGTAGDGVHAIDPVPVSGGLRFRQVHSGGALVCGLTEGGAAYCWGNNYRGQLGSGRTDIALSTLPIAVAGGHRFVEITVGNAHGCGLTEDRTVWCWGVGTEGQLGRAGAEGDAATPVRVAR